MNLEDALRDVALTLIHGCDDTEALEDVMAEVTRNYGHVSYATHPVTVHFIRIFHEETLNAAFDDEFEALMEDVWDRGDCE